MMRLFSVLLLLMACAAHAADPLQNVRFGADPLLNVRLTWRYPTADLTTNGLTFTFYGTNKISLPSTNWLFLTNVSKDVLVPASYVTISNEVWANYSVPFYLTPGRWWLTMTASNVWGRSDFSHVDSLPSPPRIDLNFQTRPFP